MEIFQLSPTWVREDGVEVDACIEVRGPAGLVQQPVRCGLPANDVQPLELPARRSA